MALLNKFGLILFGITPPEPNDVTELPTGGQVFPTCSSVIIVPGESYTFYLPLEAAINFNDGTIGIVRDNTVNQINANIGTTEDVVINTSGDRHILCRVTIPSNFSTQRPGYYRYVLHGTTQNYYSSRVWLNAPSFQDISALFSFRNSRPIGPIAYDVANMLSVRQELRLKCSRSGPTKNDTSVESYKDVSTGAVRDVEINTNKYIPFVCPNTDEIGHEGFRTLLAHKDIKINGIPVQLKDTYTESSDDVGSATFSVWDNRFSVINRC